MLPSGWRRGAQGLTRGVRARWTVSALALVAVAGCVTSDLVPCGELLCPVGKACVAEALCASAAEMEACVNHADGEGCILSGGEGRCDRGVCVATGCGNGAVEAGEACDDSNVMGGDGCAADCSKLEACGDGVADEGEGCDDGNLNPGDRCDGCVAMAWAATAVVGGTADATAVALQPSKLAVDQVGNLYIADGTNHRVWRVDATGVVTTVAGTGASGFSGDGSAATAATLGATALGVAVDGLGTVYIADEGNHRVRRVDATTGIITTVVGTGVEGSTGDGGAAISARMVSPVGVAVDGLGNLFIADSRGHQIRRVDAVTAVITTVAGTGASVFAGDGGAAISASLALPNDVAVDGQGNLYIADLLNGRYRRVDAVTGIITTVATAPSPAGVAVDSAGNVYLAENGTARVRRWDAVTGVLSSVAGSGLQGYAGDGGAATSARLRFPADVAVDVAGTVYVADFGNARVRRVDAGTAVITTVAGSGSVSYVGDGGAATSAVMNFPQSLAIDGQGRITIADVGNSRIRRLDVATGVLTTVAGVGGDGYAGDGGPAISAQLAQPAGVAVDGVGNLYIADFGNARVRRVDAGTGIITTVAGTGVAGYAGDGGAATSAALESPFAVALDALDNLYIADTNSTVRRVDAGTGIITTVAGTGVAGFAGDGGPAISAQLAFPAGLVVDGQGNLYIADANNARIRRVAAATGVITTVAGTGVAGYAGDGGLATSARFALPFGVALDGQGNLFIADWDGRRIRRVDVGTGIVTTVAGSGVDGFGGDGGPAVGAQLSFPAAVVVNGAADVYVTDSGNNLVRRVDGLTGIITTVAGRVDPEGLGPVAQGHLTDPRALVVTPLGTFVAGGSSGTVERVRPMTTTMAGWLDVVAGRYPSATALGALARYRERTFGTVGGVAYDAAAHELWLTESTANRLWVVTLVDATDARTWTMRVVNNSAGTAGFGDGALATARFRGPTGLYLDEAAHQLYVADTGNHVVRVIDLAGGIAGATVRTVAGTPATLGFAGDGGAATTGLLYEPRAVTRCGTGDVYVADTGNERVRRIAAGTGVITTVLGVGLGASFGEGAPAANFPVDAPLGLACDPHGNLVVTSGATVRLVEAGAGGVVDGAGAVETIYGGDRKAFPASVTGCLSGLAVVDATTVQVSDRCTGMVVELRRAPR